MLVFVSHSPVYSD